MPTYTSALLCAVGVFLLYNFVHSVRRNKVVARIPGPKPSSWLYGSLPELLFTKNYGEYEYQWQKTFGMTYRVRGCMGEDRVFTSDPVALRALFNNNKIFEITQYHRYLASILMGDSSVFGVEHAVHRRIRNVFNPAFTQSHIQTLLPALQSIATRLTGKLERDCSQVPDGRQFDIYEVIQYATSDVVAEAVMGYQFNSIETGGDEVSKNHHNVIALSSSRTKSALLADSLIPYVPRWIFRAALHLPMENSQGILRYQKVMRSWSNKLVKQKNENINLGIRTDGDLLSTIVGMNEDQKTSAHLKPDEIKHQIPSIMVAGQDTTGNTIAFALHELAQNLEWQKKVRAEILKVREFSNGELRDSDYDKLSYLNAHLKETLRFHAPLPITEREATEDTVLPLSKPVTATDGREITEIPLKKGEVVMCALASYNRNTDLWGEDADIFDAYRWLDERSKATAGRSTTIGPYANLASFLGGPHVCLGWRLAVLEAQIILAELVSKFSFEPVKGPAGIIHPAVAITLQPVSSEGVPHLPLRLKVLGHTSA
uniref:Cytochrome p450 n=1 Tax=Moniliophthora roreri TaxID=221103 RepID=A0A0W0EYV1_MONRR